MIRRSLFHILLLHSFLQLSQYFSISILFSLSSLVIFIVIPPSWWKGEPTWEGEKITLFTWWTIQIIPMEEKRGEMSRDRFSHPECSFEQQKTLIFSLSLSSKTGGIHSWLNYSSSWALKSERKWERKDESEKVRGRRWCVIHRRRNTNFWFGKGEWKNREVQRDFWLLDKIHLYSILGMARKERFKSIISIFLPNLLVCTTIRETPFLSFSILLSDNSMGGEEE